MHIQASIRPGHYMYFIALHENFTGNDSIGIKKILWYT